MPIPTDEVDQAFIARPHRWDIGFIRRFMTIIGPLPAVFFAVLVPLVATYLVAVEFAKRWFFRRYSLA